VQNEHAGKANNVIISTQSAVKLDQIGHSSITGEPNRVRRA
jgi:hypothetical protein